MKKIISVFTIILSMIMLFACSTQSAPITPSQAVMDCKNIYFLLSGYYGDRVPDRNAILTNTLYHLTRFDIDSLNSALPLVLSTNTTTCNTRLSNSRLITTFDISDSYLDQKLNLIYTATPSTFVGDMLKPSKDSTTNYQDLPALEQLEGSLDNIYTTPVAEDNTEQIQDTKAEDIYSFSFHNTLDPTLIGKDTLGNSVTYTYKDKVYTIKKDEHTIKIKFDPATLNLNISNLDSVIDYNFTIYDNYINFEYKKEHNNVHSLLIGGGTITIDNTTVNYNLDNDVCFVKTLNH